MNEDKELEDAKLELLWFSYIDILYGNTYCMTIEQLNKIQEAIYTVLQALENSIPKKKIEDKILQEWQKCPKNSINDFAITERNNKIQVLQELLENK